MEKNLKIGGRDRWEKNSVIHQKPPINSGRLDELFRTTLTKAWDIQKNSNGSDSESPIIG